MQIRFALDTASSDAIDLDTEVELTAMSRPLRHVSLSLSLSDFCWKQSHSSVCLLSCFVISLSCLFSKFRLRFLFLSLSFFLFLNTNLPQHFKKLGLTLLRDPTRTAQ